jgi:hypothetical protein
VGVVPYGMGSSPTRNFSTDGFMVDVFARFRHQLRVEPATRRAGMQHQHGGLP